MKMRNTFIALALSLAVITFSSSGTSDDALPKKGIEFFQGSWQAVLEESAETGKPIFVDAYAVWCGPCRWMSSNVFTNKAVGEFYNENFINYKFDMERGEGPSFARKYRVGAYPTLYYLSSDGGVLKKALGARNVDQFLTLGEQVIANQTTQN